MTPLILIHGLLDWLLPAASTNTSAGWIHTFRRVAAVVVVSVGVVTGMTWLVTEAPPSPYEIVACAERPALGSHCNADALR